MLVHTSQRPIHVCTMRLTLLQPLAEIMPHQNDRENAMCFRRFRGECTALQGPSRIADRRRSIPKLAQPTIDPSPAPQMVAVTVDVVAHFREVLQRHALRIEVIAGLAPVPS